MRITSTPQLKPLRFGEGNLNEPGLPVVQHDIDANSLRAELKDSLQLGQAEREAQKVVRLDAEAAEHRKRLLAFAKDETFSSGYTGADVLKALFLWQADQDDKNKARAERQGMEKLFTRRPKGAKNFKAEDLMPYGFDKEQVSEVRYTLNHLSHKRMNLLINNRPYESRHADLWRFSINPNNRELLNLVVGELQEKAQATDAGDTI